MTTEEDKIKIQEFLKKSLSEKGESNIKLEVRFIGYYKVRILLIFINILNLIVIPKRLVNKKTIVINCNFKIE
jgi:hypothetical protein